MVLEKFEKQIVGRKIDKLSKNIIYLELAKGAGWRRRDERGV